MVGIERCADGYIVRLSGCDALIEREDQLEDCYPFETRDCEDEKETLARVFMFAMEAMGLYNSDKHDVNLVIESIEKGKEYEVHECGQITEVVSVEDNEVQVPGGSEEMEE